MGWCRGDVDWRLRDVNAVNLRSSRSTASKTVGLWYLNKGWGCFHCETLLAGHFPTCRGWNLETGCFLCAGTDRSVCVEADVLILPSAVPIGQGAEVAPTSPTSRDVEAYVLPWCRLTLSLIHGEALLRRFLLAVVHHLVFALLLRHHLGHADALLLWLQGALLACKGLALMGCCFTLAAGL